MNKSVACVKDDSVKSDKSGLITTHGWDNISDLLGKDVWMVPRHLAEEDPTFRQIIPYVVLCSEDRKVLAYKRGSSGNEGRLHDLWSIGIGGHCDLEDLLTGVSDPESEDYSFVKETALRELYEELPLLDLDWDDLQFMGVIYLSDTPVDCVHIGLAFGAVLNSEDAELLLSEYEDALTELQWVDLEKLRGLNLENWSAILVKPLLGEQVETTCCGGACRCDQHLRDDDGA